MRKARPADRLQMKKRRCKIEGKSRGLPFGEHFQAFLFGKARQCLCLEF
jgi:hypothetical protein